MADVDVSAGLVLPNAAVALLGKGGGMCWLLLIFMAVTSASSAELIAVSSIGTYDVYKTYINPPATGRQLIAVSHSCVVLYGLVMAGFSVGLYYAGVSTGYLYMLMGVMIPSAVLPATLTLMWSKQNLLAVALSPVLGARNGGVISVETSGANNPMLAGNVIALLSPVVFVPILTYIGGPQNYDWESMKTIKQDSIEASSDTPVVPANDATAALLRASKIARSLTVFMTIVFLVLWPMPMYGTGYVFSRKFFTGWVVVGIIWILLSLIIVGIYPLYERHDTLMHTAKGVWRGRLAENRGADEFELNGQEIVVPRDDVVVDKKD
ncbi:Sodium/solute symporter [Lipomyces orientalis]|uniref:Sodium/solute symporter n=1 Tax=Lipomyces orientalis TaxID=1233043 RepID=A0ACC3TD58_9ASCO